MRPITSGENTWEAYGAPLDDAAMEQHIRALAVTLNPDSRTPIRRSPHSALKSLLGEARRLAQGDEALPASLDWLVENGRLLEAFALAVRQPFGKALPASGGIPRIQRILQELTRHSDALITPERLTACLTAFDEVRTLTMDELWAVPAALAEALSGEYLRAAYRAVQAQKQRLAAIRWADEGAPVSDALIKRSSAFFEQALRTLHERDLPERYGALAAWLAGREKTCEQMIAIEREKQAMDRLLLENTLSSLRMLESLDWGERFPAVSRTEQLLLQDPSGTYPRMEDESRASVRRRVAHIARRAGVGEATVVRCALEAAGECSDIRRELCWWLHTDRGNTALTGRMGVRARLNRLTPDPTGKRYILCVLALSALLTGFAFAVLPAWIVLWGLPLLLTLSGALVNAVVTKLVKPRPLLRLKLTDIPEELSTLVVMPALLSSPDRACQLAEQLETLGCLEKDRNLSFLLLGDLPDHTSVTREGDEEIVQAAADAVSKANLRAGYEKYYFLHRPRIYQPCEKRFMGRERKRGALNALNRLLLTGESEFIQESAAALHGRYAFVVTLDAGTRMLPGTLQRMIGALAHPINRLHREPDGRMGGYSVLSPRMELPADAAVNRFIRLYGGRGGVDSYPTAVSDVYQDLCGQGSFGGKGIYDVEAFSAALHGKLPDNAILSHDLIEGLLAKAGFLCDITLYDGHPRTFRSYYMRMNRWTRGDWQLLCLLSCRNLHLSALDKWRIADNLVRSLAPISRIVLLFAGFYLHLPAAIVLALAQEMLPLLMRRPCMDDWQRLIIRLAMLPQEAFTQLSAIIRAVWRMTVSHRRLLQWVTADDADSRGGALSPAPGWIASVLLLPALVAPAPWIVLDVLLAGLWWIGHVLADSLEAPAVQPPEYSPEDSALLTDLAARTFRFFADNTSETGLPPDNVQLDPDTGAAKRTSPTNIGMYLAGCTAARELGLIDAEELSRRAGQTLTSLERLEKWHGHLYNWYSTDSLEPLHPRYVSSVDSGNLAACLLLTARSLEREGSGGLAARAEALARGMDFRPLYCEKRRLFSIGMDVENDRLSASHYDLMASEARILSFTAILLGQVPARHWAHLGRTAVPVGHTQALLSWSGTIFEYLMPDLFLPVFPGTLLHQTQTAVIEAQRTYGPASLPWGVSESGYYAFDPSLNYQYRAFGLPALALRGDAAGDVIAPYASMLALPFCQDDVLDNLRKMAGMNLLDNHGLYEALDLSPARIPEDADARIVKSHMAHHQGMILCAICNALTDFSLVRLFCNRPEAQALLLLLQEKPIPRGSIAAREEAPADTTRRPLPARSMRTAYPAAAVPDTHLLSGGNATALLCANGSGFVRKNGVLLNRRETDPSMPPQGFFVHLKNPDAGEDLLLTGMKTPPEGIRQRVRFDAGRALYTTDTERLHAQLCALISPEDGAFLQNISLTNRTALPVRLSITACFIPVLAREEDYAAHPVFQNLFLESSRPAPEALCFRRRRRSPSDHMPLLLHAVSGAEAQEISFETDLSRLAGRSGLLSEPGALPETLSGTLGSVLTPVSALRVSLELEPHAKRELCFAVGLAEEADAAAFLSRHTAPETFARASELAGTQARELLRCLNLTPAAHHLLQRISALLLYPKLHAPSVLPEKPFDKRGLWALGISGDLPVLLAFASRPDRLDAVRDLIRAHEFYRCMGVSCDLVLVNDYESGYLQPVRERLQTLIACSHLRGSEGAPGGVHLVDGASLTDAQRALLTASAALMLNADDTRPAAALFSAALNAASALPPLPLDITPSSELPVPDNLASFNGWGGFSPEGYVICRTPAPAPWCNLLANPELGALVTERGGGFMWLRNSRNARIIPFDNDPLQEGWSDILLLRAPDGRTIAPAMYPGRVTHMPGLSRFEGRTDDAEWELIQFVDTELPVKCQHLSIKSERSGEWLLQIRMDWLLGVMRTDSALTASRIQSGSWLAVGQSGAALAQFPGQSAFEQDGLLTLKLKLQSGAWTRTDLIVAAADTVEDAVHAARRWVQSGGSDTRLPAVQTFWQEHLSRIRLITPDPLINRMVNTQLPYQTLCGRIWGRAGFYQAGGAYGFRDQLQDMLCMLLSDPHMVRSHLLLCAAHQFESGDVQHWWHPPYTGVRTRITDDMLFLPYAAAEYASFTGDSTVLAEQVPFLSDEPIPDRHEDWYGEARPSLQAGTLHEHCIRAIRRALSCGEHGLLLMGAGDWNDGMNRVGCEGRGESVWLTEFMIVVLEKYAPFCDEALRMELRETAGRLRDAVETHGWDGRWYRRAFMDDGTVLGSTQTEGGCRIDSLAQSWAVFAGLSRERARTGMEEVIRQLVDRQHGVIRLLTPPFPENGTDPGYIRGYPPGVRENGGQYTHAACWVVLALAALGMANEAWELFTLLMPYTHSDTEEKAARYRVEPYVIAADIYGEAPHEGRGGWTWYTGASGWAMQAAYAGLMGLKIQNGNATLHALLPAHWNEASVCIQRGSAVYTLTAQRDCLAPVLDGKPVGPEGIPLTDDGQTHTAVFPPRAEDRW